MFAQSDIRVHDPVVAKEGDSWYLFCTGRGISVFSSKDMENWSQEAPVFAEIPEWTDQVVPEFRNHIWAPDISLHNGTWYLYYSVSAFGKNTSAIGLATNKTLDPNSDDFEWKDQGIVIQSVPNRDLWNAIDPNLIVDENGTPWLSFGSFWEGLKMVRLQQDLKRLAEPQEWSTIARRERAFELEDKNPGDAALEAPFIFKKNDYYYLFLSWDLCCRGPNSTYKVVLGRSKNVTGPYLDKEGKSLFNGGGSLLVEGNEHWYGAGHNSTYTLDGKDYMFFHAYDAVNKGISKLKIAELDWDENLWPKLMDDVLATPARHADGYPIQPVDIREVKLTDQFWLPIIQRVQEKTISYALEKCYEEGRFDNFLKAGGLMEGEVEGAMPFDDTDPYKIIEGASNSLISAPNPELEALLDSLIDIIGKGQEEDGYLTTWRTINPAKPPAPWVKVEKGERWESLGASHELYNAGHLYEAAYTHFLATGKWNFLRIALKNADLMVKTFGDGEGQIKNVPGHQIIETGLIKLYRVTGKRDYLDLAKYFLDNRGNPENHVLYGPYSQDHVPVVQQDEVVGHAVRAVYMYAAMTDIAAIMEDQPYRNAVDKLWENMMNKKMYITGGIGAKHEGEAFGANFFLPNKTAYSETCAAIGDVYWNERLHRLTGDVKYVDMVVRTLYNCLISCLSLDGTNFFYPNALESDGKYEFNRGACTRQSWFDCSCCPTNLIRFLPSMPGLIYAYTGDTILVNLYAGNEAKVELPGKMVMLKQETNYPWDGKVTITVDPERTSAFTIKFRIPSWARNEVMPGNLYSYTDVVKEKPELWMNGEKADARVENGYFVLNRTWKSGDRVELNFPMQVRKVKTSTEVKSNQGKLALEYGPLVYAIEEMDNITHFDEITLSENDAFEVTMRQDFLGGVLQLEGKKLKAIPYYVWSNRGVGKMKIWINEKN
ncbi:MAG: glycoside hydrolase family 127 protein [Bacteroidia bacterium]